MASYPLFLPHSSQLHLLILKIFLIKQEIIRGGIELPADWEPILGTKIPSIWLKVGRRKGGKKKKRGKKDFFWKRGEVLCKLCPDLLSQAHPLCLGCRNPQPPRVSVSPCSPLLLWGWCHLGGGQPHTQQLESTQRFICMPALRPP